MGSRRATSEEGAARNIQSGWKGAARQILARDESGRSGSWTQPGGGGESVAGSGGKRRCDPAGADRGVEVPGSAELDPEGLAVVPSPSCSSCKPCKPARTTPSLASLTRNGGPDGRQTRAAKVPCLSVLSASTAERVSAPRLCSEAVVESHRPVADCGNCDARILPANERGEARFLIGSVGPVNGAG
jgi:hypothetical protein